MSVEIKTTSVEPIRNTYSAIARRFGDKPATRYQEASFDLAATTNFHYRPLWDPKRTLNDPTRTALRMEDWYSVTDPRQFFTAPTWAIGQKCRKLQRAVLRFVTNVTCLPACLRKLKNSFYAFWCHSAMLR